MGRLGTRDAAEATAVAEAVAAAPGLELVGAMTHFATADDDPAFAREQLAALPAVGAGARGPPSRAPPPCRELRRHARHPESRLGSRPLRDRRLRHGPLRRLARRARAGARARAALLPRGGQAHRAGGERGLRAPLRRGRGDVDRHGARRLRATACAGRSRTTPTCSSAGAACRSSGRSRWTTSRWTSARASRAGRRAGRAARPPGRRARARRGVGAPARHDPLRDHVRDQRARAAGAPPVKAPLEVARDGLRRQDAWIVGGAVRDQLLGRETVDLDLAVPGDPRRAARAVADQAGGAAFQLPARSAPGASSARTAPGTSTSCTLRDDDIGADLAARDFTSTRWPSRSPAARCSIRTAAGPTSPRAGCGW